MPAGRPRSPAPDVHRDRRRHGRCRLTHPVVRRLVATRLGEVHRRAHKLDLLTSNNP
ncbi:hypothetical protein [Dactylosporangium fulvum]|uniref:Uncharacterized protein n=1 Tax=Dactylosporangium fulvum TaxID=53359 RepID=A0ABY5W8T2_9ACTN|nr:hypothetical protein [Dactylosporangium fulvum]UWP86455.1 hypothetical protein Dfulv_20315 [Dactylosporangium fulvum]